MVFLDYTLQNFLLLQNNSFEKNIVKENPRHFDPSQNQELVTTNYTCNSLTGFHFTSLKEKSLVCF